MSMLQEGITIQSQRRSDPPLHLLVLSPDTQTWCTGAKAFAANTVSRKRCRECTNLLREGVANGDFDNSDLMTWLQSTNTKARNLYTKQKRTW